MELPHSEVQFSGRSVFAVGPFQDILQIPISQVVKSMAKWPQKSWMQSEVTSCHVQAVL